MKCTHLLPHKWMVINVCADMSKHWDMAFLLSFGSTTDIKASYLFMLMNLSTRIEIYIYYIYIATRDGSIFYSLAICIIQ